MLDFSFSSELDKPGQFSVSIAAGSPGAATVGGLSAAAALLRAGPNLGSGASPLPILCELSLNNGTSVISRRLARNPQRTLTAARRSITESGSDLTECLGIPIVLRASYNNVKLDDVFNAAAGTIVPLDDLGIQYGVRDPTDGIPYLSGVLKKLPVLSTWPGGAQTRLTFTAAINPDVQQTPTTLDVDSVTVLSIVDTVCKRLAGAAPDDKQEYGHWVCDVSDAALNLSGAVDWTPAPAPTSNTLVIGHQGTTPHVTFDATANPVEDETTTAIVQTERSQVASDDSGLYQAAVMTGGKSQHGIPDDARLTGLAILRGTTPEMSATRDEWSDCLLIVGAAWNNVGGIDLSGGVFYLHHDNVLRPIPSSPGRACHSLAYDFDPSGYRLPGLLMGTTGGVFYSTNDPTDWIKGTTWGTWGSVQGTSAWEKLEGLDQDVLRMQVEHDPANALYPVVFAHTRPRTGSTEAGSSIWRWAYQGTPPTWCWKPVLQNQRITDFTTTDYQTCWLALERPGDHLFMWHIGATGWTQQQYDFPLPHKGDIRHVQRVITTGPDADSVWVLLDGDQTVRNISGGVFPSPAYFILNVGGTWSDWKNANMDGTLVGPPPELPTVNVHRAAGPGVTIEPTPGTNIKVNVWLGCSTGALWTDQPLSTTTGFNWRRVSLGGLDSFAIENIALGEAVVLLGRTVNKVWMVSGNDLLVSNSSGRWFRPIKGYDRTDVAPYLNQVVQRITDAQGTGTGNTWMHGYVRTVGTTNSDGTAMTTSPIGLAASTHVYVPHSDINFIPRGLYWQRDFDDQENLVWTLKSQTAHLPGTQVSNLPALEVNTAVTARSAAEGVSIVARRFLLQHHVPIVTMTLESSFSTQQAALLTLRASMKVAVKGDITITDISSAGVAVSTDVMSFAGTEPFYVLSHQVRKGPGATAQTTTVISNVLTQHAVSPEDMGTAILDQLNTLSTYKKG